MIGGGGNDYLLGSYRDTMEGGEGSDTFAFLIYGRHGINNRITDFEQGADVIDVSDVTYYPVPGTLQFIGQAEFGGGQNEVRFEYSAGGVTLIEINFGTTDEVEFEVKLNGRIELTADDFIL